MLFIINREGNFKLKVGENVTRCELKEEKVFNEHYPWFEREQVWNIEVRNLDAKVIEVLIGTGLFYDANQEYLFVFGGKAQPAKFHFLAVEYDDNYNEKIYLGTDFSCVNGIPWADIKSGECSSLDLEFKKEWREVDWKRVKQL